MMSTRLPSVMAACGLALFILLPAIGCSSSAKPSETDARVDKVHKQAAQVVHAILQGNHEEMASLMHPALIEQIGGKEKCIDELKKAANEMAREKLKIREIRFGTLSPIVESAGELYAILPSTLDLTGPKGEFASQPGYLVCASSDGGVSWTFLDGAGVGGERSRLKKLLPNFPDALPLPEPNGHAPR